jgi:hemerythrin-like domain-containing protein
MKIDTREIQAVAATATPRVDMYAGIHKAIRALMADTLLAVGRMDASDELEVAQVTQRVVELLDFCRSHLEHENQFVHTAMEARAAGSTAVIAGEHEEHVRHIDELGHAVQALRARPAGSRDAAVLALYRQLSLFIAGNFQHMHVEETAHNAVLWARYTDAELAAIHHALVSSIPPQEMMYAVRWMVPFMNPAERAGMLQDMRANAPAPAFQAALDTVRPHLTAREWDKLAQALGLAAA